MGLFSGKTKVYVSSSLYNLAGDASLRPNVLKSVVLGSVLSGRSDDLGMQINKSLRSSSAINQKRFFSWAKKSYVYGMPEGQIGAEREVNLTAVQNALEAQLAPGPGVKLQVLKATVDDADLNYWAEAYVLANRPLLRNDEWTADYVIGSGQVRVTLPAPAPPYDLVTVSFDAPADLVWAATNARKLLYVGYRLVSLDPATQLFTAGPPKLFTYRVGAGSNAALNGLAAEPKTAGEFFPVLPLRIKNKSIRHEDFSDEYESVATGFKKLTGSEIGPILDKIEDNENIDDIDHCFAVSGVSLNTKDKAGKRYIYEFFKQMQTLESEAVYEDKTPRNAKVDREAERAAINVLWNRWETAHKPGNETHPLRNTPAPAVPLEGVKSPTRHEVQVTMPKLPEFDMRVRWHAVRETQGKGNSRKVIDSRTAAPAKIGEIWLKVTKQATVEDGGYYPITKVRAPNTLVICHQVSRHRFRMLEVIGLDHRNYVYKDKLIETEIEDALSGDGSEESDFLLPLHYPTLRKIGLARQAQLASVSTYLVMNSYEKVKQKWYQTGLFKAILVIASIAISVIIPGSGLATMGGILGSNAAVGAMLGATAATAAVVGAVANATAAMVLGTLINKASVALLGDKWGAIVGTLVSFVAMTYGSQFATQGNLSVDWSQVMKAENILGITNSVSDAYARWTAADTQEVYQQIDKARTKYEEKMDEIEKLSQDILGMTNSSFSPMILTDATEQFGESRDAFLGRTLLSGSDIAELTNGMIENFVDISLELPRLNS